MSKKLYVGNLDFSVDDDKLKEVFSEFGEIEEANVIKDKFSGKSKGFGFVTFVNDGDAAKAIAGMNDKEVEGRKLKVNEAKPFDPDAPRPRRSFGDREDRGGFRSGGGGRSFGGDRQRRF
ncbi:MAG: RNA-binding protein [Nanoarchaeota archaeon]